jgi:hypothetical protein
MHKGSMKDIARYQHTALNGEDMMVGWSGRTIQRLDSDGTGSYCDGTGEGDFGLMCIWEDARVSVAQF